MVDIVIATLNAKYPHAAFGLRYLMANLGAVGWNLSKEQVARLDAASEVPLVYPYWHQRGFEERNPRAV